MPRGRAGLEMIPAADVRATMARHYHGSWQAARAFVVSERTVRRWCETGLPLYYGAVNVTREQWERYVSEASTGRTGVDRKVSKKPRGRPGNRERAPPYPARSPKKRLRRSRELLAAYKRLHSK